MIETRYWLGTDSETVQEFQDVVEQAAEGFLYAGMGPCAGSQRIYVFQKQSLPPHLREKLDDLIAEEAAERGVSR